MKGKTSQGSPSNGTVYCAACGGEIHPETACSMSAAGVYYHRTAGECRAVVEDRRNDS